MAETTKTSAKLVASLLEGFTDVQKSEILLNMHDIGLSERDFEMLQMLRAFHILKAYIETLPESVKEAVESIKKSETSIEEITETLNVAAASFLTMVGKLEKHIDEAGKKAMAIVADDMNEYADMLKASLTDAMNKALPLSDLKKAGETFSGVVSENRQISEELRKNAVFGRRVQYGWIAIACLAVILTSWAFVHFRYEARLTESRINTVNSVVQQIEHNQDVLSELSKANRRLELHYGEKGETRVVIRNAAGYTTAGNGIIEFK